jgi:hypothetical protein
MNLEHSKMENSNSRDATTGHKLRRAARRAGWFLRAGYATVEQQQINESQEMLKSKKC